MIGIKKERYNLLKKIIQRCNKIQNIFSLDRNRNDAYISNESFCLS